MGLLGLPGGWRLAGSAHGWGQPMLKYMGKGGKGLGEGKPFYRQHDIQLFWSALLTKADPKNCEHIWRWRWQMAQKLRWQVKVRVDFMYYCKLDWLWCPQGGGVINPVNQGLQEGWNNHEGHEIEQNRVFWIMGYQPIIIRPADKQQNMKLTR